MSVHPEQRESSSSRGIQVRRHSGEQRPTGAGSTLAAIVLAAYAVVVTPFLHPAGVARCESWLGTDGYIPFAVLGASLLVLWAMALAKALQHASLGLHLSAVGLVAQVILSALVTTAMASDSTAPKAFLKIMPVGAPLACALLVFGLSLRGFRSAFDELRGDDRRLGWGIALVVLALGGTGVSVRVARFDLPLPRLGEPLQLVWWE